MWSSPLPLVLVPQDVQVCIKLFIILHKGLSILSPGLWRPCSQWSKLSRGLRLVPMALVWTFLVRSWSSTLGNLANVAMAMYKCHTMGLLPTHASDWLAFADPLQRAEVVVGGLGTTPLFEHLVYFQNVLWCLFRLRKYESDFVSIRSCKGQREGREGMHYQL